VILTRTEHARTIDKDQAYKDQDKDFTYSILTANCSWAYNRYQATTM